MLFPATGTNCQLLDTVNISETPHQPRPELFPAHNFRKQDCSLCSSWSEDFQWLHYSEAGEVHSISTVAELGGANSVCLNTRTMLSHRLDTSFGRNRLEKKNNTRGTSFLLATMKQLNSSRKPQRMLATC